MKHLVATALFLSSILSAPSLTAQTTRAPSVAPPGSVQHSAIPAEPTSPTIKFDVVYLKRCAADNHGTTRTIATGDSWQKHCQPIKTLLDLAYGGGSTYRVKGEPDWVDSDPYDFQAKVASEDVPTWQKMDDPTKRLMIRAALFDALHLKVRIQIQTRAVYNLVVAKGGPNLIPTKPDPNAPSDAKTPVRGSVEWVSMDEAAYTNCSMADLVDALAARLDRDVVNKTGLTGKYDFHVKPLPGAHYDPKTSTVENTDFGGIIEGVKNLGLRLESGKAGTTVIVIDHIERPQEN
jgi:uncharacterized protein (TIGR03435 family)